MKTTEILKEVNESNSITEKQINLLKNRANKGEKIDFSSIWDNPPTLTEDQNKKGIDFLRNLHKTPTGKERQNNPFGYREVNILENFESFELAGFYDISRYGQRSFLVPLYNCNGKDGSFQYYYDGKVQIVG